MGERLNYANLLIRRYQESKGQWLHAGMQKNAKISARDDGTTFEMEREECYYVTIITGRQRKLETPYFATTSASNFADESLFFLAKIVKDGSRRTRFAKKDKTTKGDLPESNFLFRSTFVHDTLVAFLVTSFPKFLSFTEALFMERTASDESRNRWRLK
ncbi:hypothetical protein Zmor_027838 [Zophobas morio]|uniref:Uncharacterized protein n=1 Tax=Zophobas morio TaxID=2755281 RepID=A0AA38HPW7_9CUCU|nr:hypothetical protein Zmor_027838 [Zophobas morio]